MTAAGSCPPPPPDMKTRLLPVVEIDFEARPLFRIHRSAFSPIYYNRPLASKTRYRFDAPNDEFGVLYGGFTFSSCIFETLIRNRFMGLPEPLIMGIDELDQRSVSRVVVQCGRKVRLADFTQSLAPYGGSNMVLSVDEYAGPNAWSLAIHEADQQLDGIYFQSRFSNEPCVAIFDRCDIVEKDVPTSLVDAPELAPFLDKYQITVV